MSKIYYSPDNGDTLEFRTDGLLYNKNNNAVYELDESNKVIPINTPIEDDNHPKDDSIFAHDEVIEEITLDEPAPESNLEPIIKEEDTILLPIPATQEVIEIPPESIEIKDNDQTKIEEISSKDIELPKVKEKEETTPYKDYQNKIIEYFDNHDSHINLHSVFTISGNDCHHALIKIMDEGKDIIMKETFPYNNELKKQLLEPLLVDFAKRSSLLNSRILLMEVNAKTGTYEAFSENGNVLIINNINYDYAKLISDYIKEIDYILFRRVLPDNEITLTKVKNGFVSILPMSGLALFLCGLGMLVAWFFAK